MSTVAGTDRRWLATILVCITSMALVTGINYWQFVVRRPCAVDEPNELWMAALKGFRGTLRYIGDDDGYSYFRTGSDRTPRFKRRINETNLPRHFPLNAGIPYRVTIDMVPRTKSSGVEETAPFSDAIIE